MSWPLSIMAARLATSKSGVPMNARRSGSVMRASPRFSYRLEDLGAFRLGQLAQDDVALQRRDVVDEEDALEMIHLVLDDGREQPLGVQLANLVLMVEVAHPDLLGARHVGVMLGQRQASFVVGRLVLGTPQDLGVGHAERLLRLLVV